MTTAQLSESQQAASVVCQMPSAQPKTNWARLRHMYLSGKQACFCAPRATHIMITSHRWLATNSVAKVTSLFLQSCIHVEGLEQVQ
jgi:hypothetical protein